MGNTASNNSSVIACVFVAAGKCLLIRCLETIGGDNTDSKVIS
jgi:hypothetical protein